ncbi:MAG: hypothetical protein VXW22_17405, partial [Pseudomonadota bacterium]|nr:hypothetical protein [Pseudomonadota bacterium]
ELPVRACFAGLPPGDHFAVELVQSSHMSLLRSRGLLPESSTLRNGGRTPAALRRGVSGDGRHGHPNGMPAQGPHEGDASFARRRDTWMDDHRGGAHGGDDSDGGGGGGNGGGSHS